MNYQIRDFSPEDYPAIVDIYCANRPEYPETVAELQRHDQIRPEKVRWHRFMLTNEDGRVAGTALYSQNPWNYHPQKFSIRVDVLPELFGKGLRTALYDHLVDALRPFNPIGLYGKAREDERERVAFFEARGFQELEREWESRLDPAGVDLSALPEMEKALRDEGIVITTLAELMQRDPQYARKLYELDWNASRDVPMAVELTEPSFETYAVEVFENPDLLPDGFFVAVHGDEYAGVSNLWRAAAEPGVLITGFTGVNRAYRRRGIALALKLRGIAYAREQDVSTIKTWNAAQNRPMLAINEKLGFVKQPAWIRYAKEIKEVDGAGIR